MKRILIFLAIVLVLPNFVAAIESARVDVDGLSDVIPEGSEHTLNNLTIKAIWITDQPGIEFDEANFRIIEGPPQNQWVMRSGESINIEGRTATMVCAAGSDRVRVDVDGVSDVVRVGQELEINGLAIRAISVADDSGCEFDAALLRIIGGSPLNEYQMNAGEQVIIGGRTFTFVYAAGGNQPGGTSSPSFMKIMPAQVFESPQSSAQWIGIVISIITLALVIQIYRRLSKKSRK